MTATDYEIMLRPFAELLMLLPGIYLAYLPAEHHLRFPRRKMLWFGIPSTLLMIIGGGLLCLRFQLHMAYLYLPISVYLTIGYCYSLDYPFWKSLNMILPIYAVFCYITGIVRAIEAIMYPHTESLWFRFETSMIRLALCLIFVFLCWYLANQSLIELLNDERINLTWWRYFCILPCCFIALALFLTPFDLELIYQGRMMESYFVVYIVLLLLMFLFYLLFTVMAQNLSKNDQLRQQNQFLQMERTQYAALRMAITETRHARHDMRHHFSSLSALASRKAWDELEHYLAQAQETVPSSELHLCDNPAIDGVASHYGLLCRQQKIPFSMELDFPINLPVSEIDLCLVFSNLVENAYEACLRCAPEHREIQVRGYLHSDNVVLLTVRNTYEEEIRTKNGVFQSSKRPGSGIGVQSVLRIAEKNDGYCHFTHENGIFQANVMMRGKWV